MKDEFLATLSHELRTPLNAVLGWANILRHQNLQGDELKQGLDIIERNARVQAQIIEDLLDMSRIISGKVRLDVQSIELSAVLNESIETLRSTAQAKGVYLQARLDRFARPIYGDPNIRTARSRFSGTF
jgi:signal transduction histidine kinase